jgi:hypothetical protein
VTEPFIPPVHFLRDDGVETCVHLIPVAPDSCRHCRELADDEPPPRCPRCGDLPKPLYCLGHNPDGTPLTDVPTALAEIAAEDARPHSAAVLSEAQTAELLRAMADDPVLRTLHDPKETR